MKVREWKNVEYWMKLGQWPVIGGWKFDLWVEIEWSGDSTVNESWKMNGSWTVNQS